MNTVPASIGSPLDEIRQVEAEVARQIQAAREAADERIAQAEQAAQTMKLESRTAGHREGEADFQEIVARASREAEEVIGTASLDAESLRQVEAVQLAPLVALIIESVTSVEARQIPYEPENAVSADRRS